MIPVEEGFGIRSLMMQEKVIDNELEIDLVDLAVFIAKRAWIIFGIAVIMGISCYYIMQKNMRLFYKAEWRQIQESLPFL